MSLCSFLSYPPKPTRPHPGFEDYLQIDGWGQGSFLSAEAQSQQTPLFLHIREKSLCWKLGGAVEAVSDVPWSSLLHQMCWMHCCFSRIGSISCVLALNISLSLSCLGRNRNLVRLHCLKPLLFESCHIRNGELLHAETLSANRCETTKPPINFSWIRYNW